MNKNKSYLCRAGACAIAVLVFGSVPFAQAYGGGLPDDPVVHRNMVSEAQALYGLDKDQAIKRLQAEYQAAQLYRLIRHLDISGYAGSWFDDATWQLIVAVSNKRDASRIEQLGAAVVPVTYSLDELKAARHRAESSLAANPSPSTGVRSSYIDYELNEVVFGVAPGQADAVESILRSQGIPQPMIEVLALADNAWFASAIHGADGTCNQSLAQDSWWDPNDTCHDHPCSAGVSIVEGYATAGHCGEADDQIRLDINGLPVLGTVGQSTMVINDFNGALTFSYYEDGGWVDTAAGWTPVPQIDNYGPGAGSTLRCDTLRW